MLSIQAQQAPVRPPEKCNIEGLVVKAGTGQPLKEAWVTLGSVESRQAPHVTSTDSSGRFVLKEIEPGHYRLRVERSGYVRQKYSQRGANRAGTILTLEPGQSVRDIVLRLVPTGAITGRVYDEDGDPIAGARVQALRYGYERGRREFMQAAEAVSNDLGEYRLYGLAPGHYYINGTYTPTIAKLGVAGATPAGHTGGSSPKGGYARTYYPGTSQPSGAAPIELRAGEEVGRIDLALLRTHAVRVSGRVFNAINGRPSRGARLWLVPRNSGVSESVFRNQTIVENAQGAFAIRRVTPGSYVLSASWLEGGEVYRTRQTLDVEDSDIDDLDLALLPGVELRGRVRAEGNPQIKFTDLRVLLQPRDDAEIGIASATVKSDGTFVLKNVASDVYDLTLVGIPEGFYLATAREGTDDVLESGLSVSRERPLGSLELVLNPAGGLVDGIVVDKLEQPFGGALVVLVPEASRRGQAHYYKTTTTDQHGRFTLRDIVPGEYRLFAWEDIETGAYQDSEFLQYYEKRGELVRVAQASQHNVQLKLIPLTERPQ